MNHLLIASEPIGSEDIWEENPGRNDGGCRCRNESILAGDANWIHQVPIASAPAPRIQQASASLLLAH